jgi:hypothetical protein
MTRHESSHKKSTTPMVPRPTKPLAASPRCPSATTTKPGARRGERPGLPRRTVLRPVDREVDICRPRGACGRTQPLPLCAPQSDRCGRQLRVCSRRSDQPISSQAGALFRERKSGGYREGLRCHRDTASWGCSLERRSKGVVRRQIPSHLRQAESQASTSTNTSTTSIIASKTSKVITRRIWSRPALCR